MLHTLIYSRSLYFGALLLTTLSHCFPCKRTYRVSYFPLSKGLMHAYNYVYIYFSLIGKFLNKIRLFNHLFGQKTEK